MQCVVVASISSNGLQIAYISIQRISVFNTIYICIQLYQSSTYISMIYQSQYSKSLQYISQHIYIFKYISQSSIEDLYLRYISQQNENRRLDQLGIFSQTIRVDWPFKQHPTPIDAMKRKIGPIGYSFSHQNKNAFSQSTQIL